MSEHSGILLAIKIVSMVIMFSLIMITGNLPLRWERFRKSAKMISLASAFAGGLFISVGILHLLPESREAFDDYYNSKSEDPDAQFPWSNFICVVCFAFVLFIEKVAFASYVGHDHGEGESHEHKGHGGQEHAHTPIQPDLEKSKGNIGDLNLTSNPSASLLLETSAAYVSEQNEDEEDAMQRIAQKKASAVYKLAQQAKKSSIAKKSMIHGEHKLSQLTPYILQIAIGIHATFEGMAIGIEQEISSCIGIALAVVCHKWAEGLTLGIAFFKADVDLKMSTIMIAIQAIMNPLGILIGWLLSDQGAVIRGIFQAISAGTFLYIAAGEVIVNEFNLKRNRFVKYSLFLLAIGFVTSLFFIEQATGG